MKVGFLNQQLDNRGTGNAVFNYAHYNETILGNKSVIYTWPGAPVDPGMEAKLIKRFGKINFITDLFGEDKNWDLDVLYHIKYGSDTRTAVRIPNAKYAVHAVFDGAFPHGDKFAVVSEWMGKRDNLPFVPHIVELANTNLSLREPLGIPPYATVFGRLGGYDSFDISWAWKAIERTLKNRPDVFFLFLNTAPHETFKHERVLYFPATVDDHAKRAFINTCDAMLHARGRGETFGISVGEFAILGKPIFTFGGSSEKAHIYELRGTARTYKDEDDLTNQLSEFHQGITNHPFYNHFGPKEVMAKFEEVFLR